MFTGRDKGYKDYVRYEWETIPIEQRLVVENLVGNPITHVYHRTLSDTYSFIHPDGSETHIWQGLIEPEMDKAGLVEFYH